jgi:hypothetical protein
MMQPNTNSLPKIPPPSDDTITVPDIAPPNNDNTISLPDILPARDDNNLREVRPPGEDKSRDDDDSAGETTETSEDEDSEVELDRWRCHSEQASYCERLPQPVVPIIALAHAQVPSTAPSMTAYASTAPVLAAQSVALATVDKTLPIQATKTLIPLDPGVPCHQSLWHRQQQAKQQRNARRMQKRRIKISQRTPKRWRRQRKQPKRRGKRRRRRSMSLHWTPHWRHKKDKEE